MSCHYCLGKGVAIFRFVASDGSTKLTQVADCPFGCLSDPGDKLKAIFQFSRK